MKKLTCFLLSLFLFLPSLSLGESEDADLSIEEVVSPDDLIVEEEPDEEFTLSEEEQEKYDSLLEDDLEEETGIDPNSLDLNTNLPGNVMNILLMGVDSISSDPQEILGRGGADTQIIVSINRDTGAIKMTSILRDSYVSIPGSKSKAKITSAFVRGSNRAKKAGGSVQDQIHGGAALCMRTVNSNFEMNIENYVAINFNGLASIIDALGGIDIELTSKEANFINNYLKEHPPAYDNREKGERVPLEKIDGVQHLDGVQAVMYARIRKLDNDFVRTDRQRHLLELLLQKVVAEMDISTLMDLIMIAVNYADTNMNGQTLFDLAFSVLPSLSGMQSGDSLFEQMRIPMEKTYSYQTINGSSVLSFNVKKQTKALHEFIYGEYFPAQ